MSVELLRCPFCGSGAFMWRDSQYTYIECEKYHADTHRVMVRADNDRMATELWNRRADNGNSDDT